MYRVQLASSLLAVNVFSTTDTLSQYQRYFCNYSTTPVHETLLILRTCLAREKKLNSCGLVSFIAKVKF